MSGNAEESSRSADREDTRNQEDTHLRDERLDDGEPAAEDDERDRNERELEPDLPRMRQEHLCGESEHDPVARCRTPLEVREVASGVLEQRAFMDHRQLEMRVGIVDRLAARLGDDDECERERPERERGVRPHGTPGRRGDDAREVGGGRDECRDCKRKNERRLDEHRERQVAARSHEREPVRRVPRGGGDGEARKREHPHEHERVVTEAQARGAGRERHDEHSCSEARSDDCRRQAVDRRRPLDRDAALRPEPAQFPVRLERARPAAALEPPLPVLDEPGQKRRERDPSDELACTGDERGGAHPINPSRAAASNTTTSAIR